MIGVGACLLPNQEWRSDPQIVQHVIFTKIHPFPTGDNGYSLISNSLLASVITAAFPVLFIPSFLTILSHHKNIFYLRRHSIPNDRTRDWGALELSVEKDKASQRISLVKTKMVSYPYRSILG